MFFSATMIQFKLLGKLTNRNALQFMLLLQNTPVPCRFQTTSASEGCLHLYNSLTRQLDRFEPINGIRVNWYMCGPTVYDVAHLGHARTYVSFDIIRRVLQHYFAYDVCYVMNITDIDDKIIKRGRQNHLFTKYTEANYGIAKIMQDIQAAVEFLVSKWEAEVNEDKRTYYKAILFKVQPYLSDPDFSSRNSDDVIEKLLDDARDVLSEWLDETVGDLVSCCDHSVFNALARRNEDEFHRDMQLLNVRPPDVLTRVSDYMPEIIQFIETIISKGFAYESGGTVYFDVQAFQSANHCYARLIPAVLNDISEFSEREGPSKHRRFKFDFALWKAAKPGEPYWPSPWGPGRPGWHIECSAMASAILGPKLDIHSGGLDLRFPHHDNELAQSEAHFGEPWVKYFLHSGTLLVADLKMSKSLKNFITIRETLEKYTARQIRILFLLTAWQESLEFSAANMTVAIQFEKTLQEFFLTVQQFLLNHYNAEQAESYVKWGQRELELNQAYSASQQSVHAALCNSVNTAVVMEELRTLISHTNSYVNTVEQSEAIPNCCLLRTVSTYINNLLKVFGVVPDEEANFCVSSTDSTRSNELMPYLTVLADFREKVRAAAIETKQFKILGECDRLRDCVLPELGVCLVDRLGGTGIKLVDRETVIQQRQQRAKVAAAKEAEIEKKKAQALLREEFRKTPPKELFMTPQYSQWDSDGIPTHYANGVEIDDYERKKLLKKYQAHKRRYEALFENHEETA